MVTRHRVAKLESFMNSLPLPAVHDPPDLDALTEEQLIRLQAISARLEELTHTSLDAQKPSTARQLLKLCTDEELVDLEAIATTLEQAQRGG